MPARSARGGWLADTNTLDVAIRVFAEDDLAIDYVLFDAPLREWARESPPNQLSVYQTRWQAKRALVDQDGQWRTSDIEGSGIVPFRARRGVVELVIPNQEFVPIHPPEPPPPRRTADAILAAD